MADFEKAYAWLSPHEYSALRHYSNDPDDPGGSTNWGVTQRELNSFNQRHLDLGFPASVVDLTMEQAKVITKADYWFYDGVTSDPIAAKVFDIGFNVGVHLAVEYLQQSIGILGKFVLVDGAFGPKTLAALNTCDEVPLMRLLVQYQRMHYINWVNKNPVRQKFLQGLLDRASQIPS